MGRLQHFLPFISLTVFKGRVVMKDRFYFLTSGFLGPARPCGAAAGCVRGEARRGEQRGGRRQGRSPEHKAP